MNKRQPIILLGALLLNLWSTVLLAPAFHPKETPAQAEKRLTKSGLMGAEEETPAQAEKRLTKRGLLGSVENESQLSSVENAAYNWVAKFAKGVAKYLHRQNVTFANINEITNAFSALHGNTSNAQYSLPIDKMDDETKMYISGAVQAMLDNEYVKATSSAEAHKPVDKQALVQAWLKQHTPALLNYFGKQKVSNVRTYSVIEKAAKKLRITLPDASGWGEENILDHINLSLIGHAPVEHYSDLLGAGSHLFAPVLSYMRQAGVSYVKRSDVLDALESIGASDDAIESFRNLSGQHLQELLKDMNDILGNVIRPSTGIVLLDIIQGAADNIKAEQKQSAERRNREQIKNAEDVVNVILLANNQQNK